jgi:hypothetical protein
MRGIRSPRLLERVDAVLGESHDPDGRIARECRGEPVPDERKVIRYQHLGHIPPPRYGRFSRFRFATSVWTRLVKMV